MSKRWTAVLEEELDGKLRYIKDREGWETRSETARQMILRGVENYRTSVLHSLLEKASFIAAIGALMAGLLYVTPGGGPHLIRIAALLGVSSIALGIGSMLDMGLRQVPAAPPARADGGQPEERGDEE